MRIKFTAIVVAGLIFLQGCGAGPESSAGPVESQSEVVTVTFGFGSAASSPNKSMVYYADQHDIWIKHGLNVESVFLSPTAAASALVNGDINFGWDGDVLFAAAAAKDGKVIFSAGGNPMELWSKEKYGDITELQGKKVAATVPGSTIDESLRRALSDSGMDSDHDVNIAYLQSAPASYSALTSGVVDAAVLSVPSSIQARLDGFTLVSKLEIAPTVVAANGEFFTNNQDVVKRFVEAMAEATEAARNDPEGTVEAFTATNADFDASLADEAVRSQMACWEIAPYPESWSQEILQKDPVSAQVSISEAVDSSIVEAVGAVPKGSDC